MTSFMADMDNEHFSLEELSLKFVKNPGLEMTCQSPIMKNEYIYRVLKRSKTPYTSSSRISRMTGQFNGCMIQAVPSIFQIANSSRGQFGVFSVYKTNKKQHRHKVYI